MVIKAKNHSLLFLNIFFNIFDDDSSNNNPFFPKIKVDCRNENSDFSSLTLKPILKSKYNSKFELIGDLNFIKISFLSKSYKECNNDEELFNMLILDCCN